MFKKKKCKKCGKNVEDKYGFCPYCGNPVHNSQEDFGMLGKNDFIPFGNDIRLPMGMNKIFSSLVKNLGKELNKELSNMNNEVKKSPKGVKKNGISIRISTMGNNPPEIKIDSFGNDKPTKKKIVREMPQKNLSIKNLKKLSGLPKEEPLTNVKRLSDKVIYEIEIPGVKSIEDISIIKLENSIEIKALTKNKVYAKLIPINLPITNYNLEKGKLVLELGEGN